jgi:putative FmdB family regulatory protein
MPLHEYSCHDCGRRFEVLVRGAAAIQCPGCASANVERLLSLFGVSSETTRSTNFARAKEANKKVLRDKAIADEEQAHHDHDH